MSSSSSSPESAESRGLLRAVACVGIGTLLQAVALQGWFEVESTATTFLSGGGWLRLVDALGGVPLGDPAERLVFQIGLVPFLIPAVVVSVVCWAGGAALLARRSDDSFRAALTNWGVRGWLWWFLPFVWEIARLLAFFTGFESFESFLLASCPLWQAAALAGWLATFCALATTQESFESGESRRFVWVAAGLFAVVFTTLNWQLYRGLLLPHGDSAMYEEHLWNLTHGKGFRSYLDQGLFLGEHIQVIHVLLIPLHWVWPSQMLLELCETVALAIGAIPVYRMASRHSGSQRAGLLLACAYLLYFPLHYLDISIDLKTFRPTSFAVPLVLFALDALERRKLGRTVVLLLLALCAKEDYAIVIAPLGLWIVACASLRRPFVGPVGENADARALSASRTRMMVFGAGMAVFAVVYLLLAVVVLIPYFRSGQAVHYTGYFTAFGDSPAEIAKTMVTDPGLVFSKLVTVKTVLYAGLMLVPLGLVPLLSPTRLAVALPMFGVLCLNEIAQDPRHHFHAPLIPFVFWASAAGLAKVPGMCERLRKRFAGDETAPCSACMDFTVHLAWTSALFTSVFLSLGPTGVSFWDVHSAWHWKKLYVPSRRAELFEEVVKQIPQDARVASTDYVHPRFTHCERSYDYSEYRREVSGYELTVPEDADYIVIDTQHPYSEIKRPEEVREYREHPGDWQLLPDRTEGYFIIFKRREAFGQ